MNSEEKINLAKLVSQIRQGHNNDIYNRHNNDTFNRRQRVEKKERNIVGAGGVILDISCNKLLVVKGPEKWSLPKGHLEPGEEPYEGAMREIFEETSLQVELNGRMRSKKLRKYIYYYIILENAHQLQLNAIDTNEISEVKWCSYSDLLKLNSNKQLKYFIDKWKTIIKVFYDNQRSLTMKGSVPDQEQLKLFKKRIDEERSLYEQLYATSRKGISKKEEDIDDENSSDSDSDNAV